MGVGLLREGLLDSLRLKKIRDPDEADYNRPDQLSHGACVIVRGNRGNVGSQQEIEPDKKQIPKIKGNHQLGKDPLVAKKENKESYRPKEENYVSEKLEKQHRFPERIIGRCSGRRK